MEVKSWVMSVFNDENIAKRFVEEKITGTTLLSQHVLNENSMERLALNTIGKKEKFSSSVQNQVGGIEFKLKSNLDYCCEANTTNVVL